MNDELGITKDPTIKVAAAMLDCSERQIWRYIKEGRLKIWSYVDRGTKRVHLSSLQEFIISARQKD